MENNNVQIGGEIVKLPEFSHEVFEEKFYKKENITAKYVGHPLVSQLNYGYQKEDFIRDNNLNENKKIVLFRTTKILFFKNIIV